MTVPLPSASPVSPRLSLNLILITKALRYILQQLGQMITIHSALSVPNNLPHKLQDQTQNCVCVCLKADDTESVPVCVCVLLFLSKLQKQEELCVCVCVSQVPTSFPAWLGLVWPVSDCCRINRSLHIDSFYHIWLGASVSLCSLIFGFNHLYPQEAVHYVRLLNCNYCLISCLFV